jgi:hypothetical protein
MLEGSVVSVACDPVLSVEDGMNVEAAGDNCVVFRPSGGVHRELEICGRLP